MEYKLRFAQSVYLNAVHISTSFLIELLILRETPEGLQGFPCPFSKIGKNCPNFTKKCPDCGHLWQNFSFKMKFLRVFRRKTRRFFHYGTFLSRVVGECLSKCPNSKKTPLPQKIPGYAPVILKATIIVFIKIALINTLMKNSV